MVEKEVHAFEHLKEAHCTATDKHFHRIEHNCAICDFTSTDSNSISENHFSFIATSSSFLFNDFSESVNFPLAFSDLPSRAPPVV